MYTSVRRYEGVTDPSEVIRQVNEGFLPIISEIEGFVNYSFVGEGWEQEDDITLLTLRRSASLS